MLDESLVINPVVDFLLLFLCFFRAPISKSEATNKEIQNGERLSFVCPLERAGKNRPATKSAWWLYRSDYRLADQSIVRIRCLITTAFTSHTNTHTHTHTQCIYIYIYIYIDVCFSFDILLLNFCRQKNYDMIKKEK